MDRYKRACQIWAVLAWAATNRQSLTYGILAKLIGPPAVGHGKLLEPIQSYCLQEKLPPLTILVVQKDSGIPGTGFTGESVSKYAEAYVRVFEYDWLGHGNPGPEKLEAAAENRPSNG